MCECLTSTNSVTLAAVGNAAEIIAAAHDEIHRRAARHIKDNAPHYSNIHEFQIVRWMKTGVVARFHHDLGKTYYSLSFATLFDEPVEAVSFPCW